MFLDLVLSLWAVVRLSECKIDVVALENECMHAKEASCEDGPCDGHG